mgnify:CR=1 FL=1
MSLSLLSSEPRSMNQLSCSERNASQRSTSESEPEEVVILLNYTPLDKLFQRPSSLTTKNSRTSNPREKSRKSSFNTTELSSSLTQEDQSQRNTAVLVPDPENKNHTVKSASREKYYTYSLLRVFFSGCYSFCVGVILNISTLCKGKKYNYNPLNF